MNINEKNFVIIAGVHKAATTSLYEYFIRHYEVCSGEKKEIHYYTPLRYGKVLETFDKYQKRFEKCSNNNFLIDASPSYLYGKALIANKIKEDLVNAKIIVILRDPVERMVSFYRFLKAGFRIDEHETFIKFVNKSMELKNYDDKDDVYYRAFREGCYSDYLEDWLDIYKDNIKIIFFDDLKKDPQSTMLTLSDWIGIDRNVYNNDSIFTISNQTQASRIKSLHHLAHMINMTFENFWRKNKKLKGLMKFIYFKLNGMKKKEEIEEEDKETLRSYYKHEYRKLYELLKKHNYNDFPSWLEYNDLKT